MNAGTVDGTSSTRTPSRAPVDVMTTDARWIVTPVFARVMAAVVRRGEESSSEEEDEDDDREFLDPSSPSKSVSRASASVTSPRAKGRALADDGRIDARDARDDDHDDARATDRENVAPDVTGRVARPRCAAVDFGTNVPNTKLVAKCVAALREAPIARAASAAEARDRDLGILSQTSASMTSVNAHAREAALAARETSDALRRLTEFRFGRDDDALEDEEAQGRGRTRAQGRVDVVGDV